MELTWTAIFTAFSSGLPWVTLAIIMIHIVWKWFTSNNIERLFLSKSVVLINKFIELMSILLFIFILTIFSIFLSPPTLESLTKNTTIPIISLALYFLIYIFLVFESTPFIQKVKSREFFINKESFFRKKYTSLSALFVFLGLATYLFRHIINLSAFLYLPFVEAYSPEISVNTSSEIFTFLINEGIREYSYRIFLPFIVWFSIFTYALAIPVILVRRKLLDNEQDKKVIKTRVVLKDGSEFVDVYLQNSSSANFFHLHNKPSSPTQYLVLHKDEVKLFLFDEHNHKTEDGITSSKNEKPNK